MKGKGFTLVEIIAVIAILGLLIAIALPQVLNQFGTQREAMTDHQKNLIIEATRLHVDEHEGHFSTNVNCIIELEQLVVRGVLNANFLDNTNFAEEYLVLVSTNGQVHTVTVQEKAAASTITLCFP